MGFCILCPAAGSDVSTEVDFMLSLRAEEATSSFSERRCGWLKAIPNPTKAGLSIAHGQATKRSGALGRAARAFSHPASHSPAASDRRRFIPIARTDISTNLLLGRFNSIDCKFAHFALRFGGRPIAPHGLGDRFYGLGDRKNSRPNSGSAFRTRKKGPTEALIFISTAKIQQNAAKSKSAPEDAKWQNP